MKVLKLFILANVLFFSCKSKKTGIEEGTSNFNREIVHTAAHMDTLQTATFGAGCFWCVEAIFQQVEGVKSVVPGYAGGHIKNPSYKEVCTGRTGHAEVAQLVYDPAVVNYDHLLEVFWKTHDPTTLNRQGNDVGTQYRSVIFYHNEEQRQTAEKYKKELDNSGAWDNPIVTQIEPIGQFYEAEDYHKNYYNNNSGEMYCKLVIQPKLEKYQKIFGKK